MSPARDDDDDVASGEDGNRCRMWVNADGRVIVETAAILADKPGIPA